MQLEDHKLTKKTLRETSSEQMMSFYSSRDRQADKKNKIITKK